MLDWSSVIVKVLGVFLGPGDLEEDSWCSRITALENTLASWKGRSLLYRDRALVINALALSRLWYVVSLVHMPPWVSSDLCKLAFDLFWKGKRDVVPSSVIVDPTFAGSFKVFDVKLKVWSLIVQWVSVFLLPLLLAGFPSCPAGFVLFLVLLLLHDVLSSPFRFNPRALPPFYCFLLLAWRAMDGAFSSSRSCLVMGSFSPYHLRVPFGMSTKFGYVYLLSEHQHTPHSVDKFLPSLPAYYLAAGFLSFFIFFLSQSPCD